MPKKTKRARDIEKVYSIKKFAEKLRRLADALEAGEQFRIQVAGSDRAEGCENQHCPRTRRRRRRNRISVEMGVLNKETAVDKTAVFLKLANLTSVIRMFYYQIQPGDHRKGLPMDHQRS